MKKYVQFSDNIYAKILSKYTTEFSDIAPLLKHFLEGHAPEPASNTGGYAPRDIPQMRCNSTPPPPHSLKIILPMFEHG